MNTSRDIRNYISSALGMENMAGATSVTSGGRSDKSFGAFFASTYVRTKYGVIKTYLT